MTDDYRAYLSSDDWQRNRQPALDRAHGVCERCGCRPLWLEVHHKHYRTLGCEAAGDIEALCHECHVVADRQRAYESSARRESRGFEGWASKVYGENWELRHSDCMERRFEAFVERRERLDEW